MHLNIHGATVEGVMRELCNAFVRRRGAVPSVPDMMKTYRRVVRHLDDVLVNARANSLFEARVFEDLCFVRVRSWKNDSSSPVAPVQMDGVG
jgi:hypothetical protein